ncbi:MAG TPA: 4Fe-4S dicluster domain-containing protein [Baekduia sp.]
MRPQGRRSNAWPAVFLRRSKERAIEGLNPVMAPVMVRLAVGVMGARKYEWLRFAPKLPRQLGGWARPRPWDEPAPPAVPEALRSYAGTLRDAEAEQRAFDEGPLHDFTKVHLPSFLWALRRAWPFLLPTFPRRISGARECHVVRDRPAATGRRREIAPDELARMIRAEARRLGISQVGFAKADVKYTYAEFPDPGDANIVVCVMEQDWRATQKAPSAKAERAAFRGYGDVLPKAARLVAFLQDLGYAARPNDGTTLEGMAIHYGVEAGLGQLGLNGQLLTPEAGSRARLALITTDAPMALGTPVDYGIPRICDECQLCVRRCPPGAIPLRRKEKRGVVKAAIKPERCFPVMASTHGCAVCMKVCPIQRYGLAAVLDHHDATGAILGKGTDELEGYVWPHDGRYYGPGEKPRMTRELLEPEGFGFDKTRT